MSRPSGVRLALGIASVALIAAGAVAMILAELVLAEHGGSCAAGNTPYVPARTCTPSDLRNGALLGGGIVAVVIASFGIAFTFGVNAMFAGLGAAFLIGGVCVAIGGSGALVTVAAVWGLLGAGFLVGGALGLRSELRAARTLAS